MQFTEDELRRAMDHIMAKKKASEWTDLDFQTTVMTELKVDPMSGTAKKLFNKLFPLYIIRLQFFKMKEGELN